MEMFKHDHWREEETRLRIEHDERELLTMVNELMFACSAARLRPKTKDRIVARIETAITFLEEKQLPHMDLVENKTGELK